MKFKVEELLEALKAKLAPNGKNLAMSERTLNANVEKIYKRLEKAGSEDELGDVVAEYLPDFEEINGNIQKDNSDFIKKWRAEHPETKPEAKPQDEAERHDGDDKLDKLLKEIEGLKAERKAEKTAKAISEKKTEMLAQFKAKGINDEKWLQSYVKKLNIAEDTDIEAETADALAFYNISHSETGEIRPGRPEKNIKITGHEWDDVKSIRKPAASNNGINK